MRHEALARVIVGTILVSVPLTAVVPRWLAREATDVIELRGSMPEAGGWTPDEFTATVGQPVRLRLTSDDVMHSFAIGRMGFSPVDVEPGVTTDTTVIFERPGRYVFYCNRWCGPDHWRMRGTIWVRPANGRPERIVSPSPPLYERLGLDLDAPHPAEVVPDPRPSAVQGAALGIELPDSFRTTAYYRAHSPAETWRALRADPLSRELADGAVWDLVALIWASQAPPDLLREGRTLYAVNCAACHGESGAGDGVMADRISSDTATDTPRGRPGPADFTDGPEMLGAAPGLFHGKIIRGGMGTGMPNWGAILTDRQTWALVAYLWTFQLARPGHTDPTLP